MSPTHEHAHVQLNTGAPLPILGLGTYQARGSEAERAVQWALEAGYRLIDTSLAYWNEEEVGRGLRASGVPRGEVFLTSKLENDDQGYESALRACETSLRNLGTDYLDLYLIHWPVPGRRADSWRAMERLVELGLCRAVGVSNYTIRHLEELLAESELVPAVDQVEFHPFLYQKELLDYCRHRGIVLQAYSPLAKARLFDDPAVLGVAGRVGRTPAQVFLRWQVEHRVPAIPKSVRQDHQRENLGALEFSLPEEELARLDGMSRSLHLDWNPDEER